MMECNGYIPYLREGVALGVASSVRESNSR